MASDANVSYKRAPLEAIRPIWQSAFVEPEVNRALVSRGERILLSSRLVVRQYRIGLTVLPSLRERNIWGRSYAAARSRGLERGRRMAYACLSPLLPGLLLLRIGASVFRKKRGLAPFVRALPLTALLLASWSAGEMLGYLTQRAGHETELPE